MLVLSRKRNESIVLEIPPSSAPRTVTLTLVRGDHVRLGFDAEKDINIRRAELPEGHTERAA